MKGAALAAAIFVSFISGCVSSHWCWQTGTCVIAKQEGKA